MNPRPEHDEMLHRIDALSDTKRRLLATRLKKAGPLELPSGTLPKRLVGFVAGPSSELDGAMLRDFLRHHLPAYMMPDNLIVLDTLPKTASGKPDRQSLLAMREEGWETSTAEPPRTPTERALAGIWCNLLHRSAIAPADNFFALGGHSLLATRLISRIRDVFGVNLPVRGLFDTPELAELAALVDRRRQVSFLPTLPPDLEITPPHEPAPLSPAQSRVWFLQRLSGGSTYNMIAEWHLTGRLDIGAVAHALRQIVVRHEPLRTVFPLAGKAPIQKVQTHQEVPLPVVDLGDLPVRERETELARRIAALARTEFNLERGPVCHFTLLATGRDSWSLVIVMHHIVSDAWSMSLMLSEIGAFYRARVSGERLALPNLIVRFADFARWSRRRLHGPELRKQLRYWLQKLARAPRRLVLPGRARPKARDETRGEIYTFAIPRDGSPRLERLARRLGASSFMAYLAVFEVLLHRLTGSTDLVVGTPFANRDTGWLESIMGFFVNTLPLRIDLKGDPSFRSLLMQIRQTALEAYENAEPPFDLLVRELNPPREPDCHPLFQVMFILKEQAPQRLNLPGLTLTTSELTNNTAKFDLILAVERQESGWTAEFEYNRDLFNPETLSRFAEMYLQLLDRVTLAPDLPISRMPLLSVGDRADLLRWSTNSHPLSHDSINSWFSRTVTALPNKTALQWKNRGWSYRNLNQQANRIAYHLIELGAGAETPVALFLERTPAYLIALLAILKAGACVVPIDNAHPVSRVRDILDQVRPTLLLTNRGLANGLSYQKPGLLFLEEIQNLTEKYPVTDSFIDPDPDQLAYLVHTSGSTGRPKGIALSHRVLNNLIAWQHHERARASRTLLFAPLGFDVLFQEVLATWRDGGMLEIPSEEERHDPSALLELCDRQRIERLFLPFVALNQLAEQALRRCWQSPYPKQVISAGERLRITPAIRTFFQAGRSLENQYGPAETHVVSSHLLAHPSSNGSDLPPIGRPIYNTGLYVLDRHAMEMPIGTVGELYIGGQGLARGYFLAPRLTAERFLPNHFCDEPGARHYRTGDLANYRADGKLEFHGRNDDQVKIRGYRVEPREIETVLCRHSDVEAAVVVPREKNENLTLAAFVVTKNKKNGVLGIRTFLGERLPAYMLPASITRLERLPVNANGKLDHGALPAPRPMISSTYLPPDDDVSWLLAEVWGRVLGVDPVGPRDNFFELGGHSLLAVTLIAEIERIFSCRLPLSSLFRAPTIVSFAELLRGRESQRACSVIFPLCERGSPPPIFFVHPGGGHIFCYAALTRSLGAHHPFYAFQAPGLEDDQRPLNRVEALAARYLTALKKVRPNGPYVLGGWSLGGTIAFEMACLLESGGDQVDRLVLCDTYAPRLMSTPQPDGSELSQQLQDYLTGLLGRVPANMNRQRFTRLRRVFRANLEAVECYRPKSFGGSTLLFRSEPDGGAQDRGWGPWLHGNLEIINLAEGHYELMGTKGAALIASRLRGALASTGG